MLESAQADISNFNGQIKCVLATIIIIYKSAQQKSL